MKRKEKLNLQWSECQDPQTKEGTIVYTACGGITTYTKETPCVEINGEQVFFCLPLCKQDFVIDPRFSCLANKLEFYQKPN